MIYDCFNFNAELDLLEIRLGILYPYVDKFVLLESAMTHSGLPKPLYYELNKARFSKWQDKIIHHIIPNPPMTRADFPSDHPALTSSKVPPGESSFMRDFFEKEAVKDALVGVNDTDLIFVSDLDEIWNPEILDKIQLDGEIYRPDQLSYCYFLNLRTNEKDNWTGTIATTYKTIKENCLNHLRAKEITPFVKIERGGWHFTNMGGVDLIKQKFESNSHQEINTKYNKAMLVSRMADKTDYIGRDFKMWVDEFDLPKYLLDNREKYAHLFN